MDRIHPLKMESASSGGTQTDNFPTALNKNEDYVDVRGITFQNDTSNTEDTYIDRDASDNINVYTDGVLRVSILSTGATVFNTSTNTFKLPPTRPTDTYLLGAIDALGTLGWIEPPDSGYFYLNTSTTPDRIVQPISASYTEDFVFGSPSLDYTSGASYYNRFFYDDSTYSFRAGRSTFQEWDTRGLGSTCFGLNCEAPQNYAFSTGNDSTSKGIGSVSFGYQCNARGQYTMAGGYQTVVGASDNQASSYSFGWGYSLTVTGINTAMFGYNSTSDANYSLLVGYGHVETGGNCNIIAGESGTFDTNSFCLITGQSQEVALCRYTSVIGANADVYDCDGCIVSGTTNNTTYQLSQTHSIMQNNNCLILGGGLEVYDSDYSSIIGYRHAISQLSYSAVIGQLHYYQTDYNRDNSLLIGRYGVVEYTGSLTISPGSSTESGNPAVTNGDFQTIMVEGVTHNADISDTVYTNLLIGRTTGGVGNTNTILVRPNHVVDYKIKIIGIATSSAGVLTAGDTVIYELEGAYKWDGTFGTYLYTNITTLYEASSLIGLIDFTFTATGGLGSTRAFNVRALSTAGISGENFNWKTSFKIINSTWN